MVRSSLDNLRHYTRFAIGWREIGGPQPRPEDVISVVRQYHRDSLLVILTRLNLALTHPNPPSQEALVRLWAPGDVGEQLLKLCARHHGGIVFHEAQLLNLIRMAMLHAPADEGSRLATMEEFLPLTRALLMMTDLMFPSEGSEPEKAMAFSSLTQSEIFYHDDAFLPRVLARSADLFIHLPRLPTIRRGRPEIGTLFRHITGLAIEDYFALVFGLLTYYDNLDPSSIGDAPIGIDRQRVLAESIVPQDTRERLWRWLSLPLKDYQAMVQEEWNRLDGPSRWSAMRSFTQFPMVELTNGSLLAFSRRFLRDRLTDGIYWIFANALKGADRDRFTEYFGDVYEEYVRRCFLRVLGRSFHPRATYGPASRPVCDGVLSTTRSLGLVECKAGRLLLSARERGSEEDLSASMDRPLDVAAGQLSDAILGIQSGALHDLDATSTTKFYPIVVTYEPLPSHPWAQQIYEKILHRNGRLQGANIKPVTLLNARDIELLEAMIEEGEEWPDALTRKTTEKYQFLTFNNYVYDRYRGQVPRAGYAKARWGRVGEMIGNRLFGTPLNRS